MNLSPKEMLKLTESLEKSMVEAKKTSVYVGLPKEKAGGQIYGDGRSIMENAAVHEYGSPKMNIPERSFLRTPFKIKKSDIAKAMEQQWQAIAQGKRDVATGLGRFGAEATNIVMAAFKTGGFGKWADLKPATIKAKGHGKVLEDTRVMRNSITWVVRDD